MRGDYFAVLPEHVLNKMNDVLNQVIVLLNLQHIQRMLSLSAHFFIELDALNLVVVLVEVLLIVNTG